MATLGYTYLHIQIQKETKEMLEWRMYLFVKFIRLPDPIKILGSVHYKQNSIARKEQFVSKKTKESFLGHNFLSRTFNFICLYCKVVLPDFVYKNFPKGFSLYLWNVRLSSLSIYLLRVQIVVGSTAVLGCLIDTKLPISSPSVSIFVLM